MAMQLREMDKQPAYNPSPPDYKQPGQPGYGGGYGQHNQPGYGQPYHPGYGQPNQPGYNSGYGPSYPQQQQQQHQVVQVGPIIHVRPPTYLALAVITSIFFNPFCGGIAIICSVMSSSAADEGNTETARTRGKISCALSIIGIIIGPLAVITGVVYYVVYYAANVAVGT